MINQTEYCQEIQELLSAYVDGEASAPEAARVETHLLGCRACASHLAFLQTFGAVWQRLPPERPSAHLSDRIARATYARPRLLDQILDALRPMPTRLALGTALGIGIVSLVVRQQAQAPLEPLPPATRPAGRAAAAPEAPRSAVSVATSHPAVGQKRVSSAKVSAAEPAAVAAPIESRGGKTPPLTRSALGLGRSGIGVASVTGRGVRAVASRPSSLRSAERIAMAETRIVAKAPAQENAFSASAPEPEAPAAPAERAGVPIDSGSLAMASLGSEETDDAGATSGRVSWKEFARSGNEPLRALRGSPAPRSGDASRVSVVDAPVTTQTH